MVVGIKAVCFVAHRNGESDGMPGHRVGESIGCIVSVASGFEAIAVTQFLKRRRIPVIKSPALFKNDRRVGADDVKTVVAVEPCPATSENIAGVARVGVAAKAV